MRTLSATSLLLIAGAFVLEAQVVNPKQPIPLSNRQLAPAGARLMRGTILLGTSPNSSPQGKQVVVTVNGWSTHFAGGATTLDFGSGVSVVGPVQANASNTATATVNIAWNAPTGPHTVTATSGTEVVALAGGFTVYPGDDGVPGSCAAADNKTLALGPGQSTTLTANIDNANAADWVVIRPGSAATLTLTLTAQQPGSEFDMTIVSSCTGTQLGATVAGNPSKQLTLVTPPPGSSPYSIRVMIRATHWDITAPWYRLVAVVK